jgi:hypothetical protein
MRVQYLMITDGIPSNVAFRLSSFCRFFVFCRFANYEYDHEHYFDSIF